MTQYFLHQRNEIYVRDEEGEDFADLAAAREKAVIGARSILSEELMGGAIDLRGAIEIADTSGDIVEIVPFGETVTIRTGK
ncbi:MAG: hypothetical protein V4574_16810 [Pseudomonadota bacterium]